jgi:hypothetical protein
MAPDVRHCSGPGYRTPSLGRLVGGGVDIQLPHNVNTGRCQNAQAVAHFTNEQAGQIFEVGNPEVIAPAEALPLVRDQARRAWQRFHCQNFSWLRTLGPDSDRAVSKINLWKQPPRGLGQATPRVRTTGHRKESTMSQEEAKRRSERVTGVSNVAYDLMVVLTNKLEGVAAMEEYKLDADAANDPEVRAALERIEQRERQSIEELRGLLLAHLQRIQRH